MRLYYHHVGQDGSEDFRKTVFNDVDIDILDLLTEGNNTEYVRSTMKALFPSGRFNCWGVPKLAYIVLRHLSINDYVLLVESVRINGMVPALCQVKFLLPTEEPELSKALWGKEKYPYIFFFQTERLNLPWIDFHEHMKFADRFDPRGKFYSIGNPRLTELGGIEAYIQHLRKHYSDGLSIYPSIRNKGK